MVFETRRACADSVACESPRNACWLTAPPTLLIGTKHAHKWAFNVLPLKRDWVAVYIGVVCRFCSPTFDFLIPVSVGAEFLSGCDDSLSAEPWCSKLNMANFVEATSKEQFDDFLSKAGKNLTAVHFQAAWAHQCGQMNEVMAELAKTHPHATFVKLEAEAVPEVSERYEITSVPTFLFFRGKEQVDRLDGANAPELTKKVGRLAASGSPSGAAESPGVDLNQRLKRLINAAPCMLFMKGTAQEPRCGFSRQIVALLSDRNIQFSTFDILSDEEVRQGLKTFSNWPTYPQLYVNGELVGGLDIVKELAESGELANTCPTAQSLEHRLKTLINRSPVMLFMKGNKEAAKCGFSRQTLSILNNTGVDYDTFDILQDEEVRQGLKTFSNWPTYPQLYVKGELIGGLDIIKELEESGELVSTLKAES